MTMPYRSVAEWQQVPDAITPDAVTGSVAGTGKLLLAAAVATALLLLGPRLGAGSGVMTGFHDAGLQQLAQARLYQGLDWGAARLWPGADLSLLVLACQVLAVLGCCFGLLRIVARLAGAGAEDVGLAAGALLIGLTYLDGGAGFVAGGSLVGGGFTAAQAAVALAVLSIALALDGWLATAVALLGLTCDMSVGVALWGLFALAGASAGLARDGVRAGRAWLAGGAGALVLAVPALLWWWHHVVGGSVPTAGNAAAVTLLQLHRWMLLMVPLQDWILFGCAAALGLAAFSTLGPGGRAGRNAFLGVLTVFVLGCGLPLVTTNPLLLGLQPVAADELVQLLAAAAATAVIVRDLQNGRGLLRVVLSAAVGACLLLHPVLLPLAALAMLSRAAAAHGELLGVERRIRDLSRVTLCRLAMSVVAAAAVGGFVLRSGLLPQ